MVRILYLEVCEINLWEKQEFGEPVAHRSTTRILPSFT